MSVEDILRNIDRIEKAIRIVEEIAPNNEVKYQLITRELGVIKVLSHQIRTFILNNQLQK